MNFSLGIFLRSSPCIFPHQVFSFFLWKDKLFFPKWDFYFWYLVKMLGRKVFSMKKKTIENAHFCCRNALWMTKIQLPSFTLQTWKMVNFFEKEAKKKLHYFVSKVKSITFASLRACVSMHAFSFCKSFFY